MVDLPFYIIQLPTLQGHGRGANSNRKSFNRTCFASFRPKICRGAGGDRLPGSNDPGMIKAFFIIDLRLLQQGCYDANSNSAKNSDDTI